MSDLVPMFRDAVETLEKYDKCHPAFTAAWLNYKFVSEKIEAGEVEMTEEVAILFNRSIWALDLPNPPSDESLADSYYAGLTSAFKDVAKKTTGEWLQDMDDAISKLADLPKPMKNPFELLPIVPLPKLRDPFEAKLRYDYMPFIQTPIPLMLDFEPSCTIASKKPWHVRQMRRIKRKRRMKRKKARGWA